MYRNSSVVQILTLFSVTEILIKVAVVKAQCRAPDLTCGLRTGFITRKTFHNLQPQVKMTCGFFGNTLLGNIGPMNHKQ